MLRQPHRSKRVAPSGTYNDGWSDADNAALQKLLQPLRRFPLHKHRVWLVNNDFYQDHGLSPLPSASIHAFAMFRMSFSNEPLLKPANTTVRSMRSMRSIVPSVRLVAADRSRSLARKAKSR